MTKSNDSVGRAMLIGGSQANILPGLLRRRARGAAPRPVNQSCGHAALRALKVPTSGTPCALAIHGTVSASDRLPARNSTWGTPLIAPVSGGARKQEVRADTVKPHGVRRSIHAGW